MIDDRLRIAVATDDPIVLWQARCADALAAVPGVTIERWIRVALDPSSRRECGGHPGLGARSDARRADRSPGEDPRRPDVPGADRCSRRPDDGRPRARRSGGHPRPGGSATAGQTSSDPALTALVDYVRGSGVTRVGPDQPPFRDRPARGVAANRFVVDREAGRRPAARYGGLAGRSGSPANPSASRVLASPRCRRRRSRPNVPPRSFASAFPTGYARNGLATGRGRATCARVGGCGRAPP